MNTQPKALRLADACDTLTKLMLVVPGLDTVEAAAELRRLHNSNQELLTALKAMLRHMGMDEDKWNKPTFDRARAAIARAEKP